MACLNVDEFRKIHNHQLKSIGFPNNLVQDLFNQLSSDDEPSIDTKQSLEIKKSGNTSKFIIIVSFPSSPGHFLLWTWVAWVSIPFFKLHHH